MHVRFALLAVAALLLAGCSGGGAETGTDLPPAFQQPPDLGAGKGLIRGLVVTPALVPVQGALVALTSGPNATTDVDGAFVFADLQPGTYFLTVGKPGWTNIQQSVDVVADVAEPPIVKIVIDQLPGTEPRAVTLFQEGFIACSIGTPVSYHNCAVGDERSSIYFDIDGTPDWIQTEILWESTQPVGDWLYVVQGICSCDGGVPPVGGARFNETDSATTGYTARASPAFLEEWGVGTAEGKQLIVDLSASGPEPSRTNGSGVALNQAFEVYATFFYNLEPAGEWRFAADGPYPVPE